MTVECTVTSKEYAKLNRCILQASCRNILLLKFKEMRYGIIHKNKLYSMKIKLNKFYKKFSYRIQNDSKRWV